MKKRILSITFITLVIFVIVYLLLSFVKLELNFLKWEEKIRFFHCALTFAFSLFINIMLIDDDKI